MEILASQWGLAVVLAPVVLVFSGGKKYLEAGWESIEPGASIATLAAAVLAWFLGLRAGRRANARIKIRVQDRSSESRLVTLPLEPLRTQLSRAELLGILGMYHGSDRIPIEGEDLRPVLEDLARDDVATITVPLESGAYQRIADAIQSSSIAPASSPLRGHVFVRCGSRYEPPADGHAWAIVTLPDVLEPGGIPDAVKQVRTAVRGYGGQCTLLVSGPVTLGIALGQGLAHESVAIDYVQLDQPTKAFGVWVTNRDNL